MNIQSCPDTPEEMVAYAESTRRSGRAERALLILKPRVTQDPTDIRALLVLGRCLIDLDRFEEARNLYETLLSAAPRLSLPYLGLAHGHLGQGEANEALAALDGHELMFGLEVPAARLRARAFLLLDRKDLAREALQRVAGLAASDGGFWIDLGRLHHSLDDAGRAIRCWQRAARLQPRDETAHRLIFEGSVGLSWWRAAARSGLDLIAISPVDTELELRVTRVLILAKKLNEAADLIEKVTEREPDNGEPWMLSGLVAERLDEMKEARAAYHRVLQIDPRNSAAAWRLARLAAATGDGAGQRAYLNRLRFLTPHNSRVLEACATLDLTEGRWSDASRAFRQVLLLDPSRRYLLGRLGEVTRRLGHLDEARRLLMRHLRTHRGDAGAWLELGYAYRGQGLAEESRQCFERVRHFSPDGPLEAKARHEISVLDGRFNSVRPVLRLARRATG